MTVFFWADLHFNDPRIAAERGFPGTGEHDNHVIAAWSGTVTDADTVWVAGDLSFDDPTQALEILRWLPGRKHLVLGNHDTAHPMHANAAAELARYLDVFDTVSPSAQITLEGRDVSLSHFPYSTGKARERYADHRLTDQGAWLVHGHVHEEWRRRNRQINCGVDMWPGGPVAAQTLTSIMDSYEDSLQQDAA